MELDILSLREVKRRSNPLPSLRGAQRRSNPGFYLKKLSGLLRRFTPRNDRSLIRFIILFFTCWSSCTLAAHDVYQFTNAQQHQQFNTLSHELRCLVCQNENLADSDAKLATDLRNIIYAKILHGENNQQIIHYMVSRYGNFVLFKPPLEKNTYILWFAPFGFLLCAFAIMLLIVYRKRS